MNETQPTDQDALTLTHAIALQESGGGSNKPNYNAVGDAGTSHGAYQWQPGNFEAAAKKYGLDPNDKSPMNQDKVAYHQVKEMKDKGLDPGQIASTWNSGSPNNWKDHSGTTVINGQAIKYDTPGYVRNVQKYYQQLKGQQPAPQTSQGQAQGQPQQNNSLFDKISNVIQTIFPGKQIGNAIGTQIAKMGASDEGKKFIDKYEPGPSALQVAGDVGQAGLMIGAPGLGGETALGRIGGTALLGAGSGVAGALSGGSTNPGEIAKQGLVGGLVGGAAGGVGELLSKATQYLPYSIARKFLSGTSEETAQYAADKGLGTPTSMLTNSDSNLTKVGNAIETILTDPSLEGVTATAQDVYPSIIDKYPNAGLTMENVGEQLKKMAPLEQGLVDKLETQGLTPLELNNLKSAIAENTYKMRFDEPAVKAGKSIGNSAYAAMSDWLKNTLPAIRSDVPDISPVFDEYSKELQLNAALRSLIRRGEKAKLVTLPDIMAMISGSTFFGPGGGLGAVALEKAVRSPSVNLLAGNAINKLNTPVVGGLARTALTRGISKMAQAQSTQ